MVKRGDARARGAAKAREIPRPPTGHGLWVAGLAAVVVLIAALQLQHFFAWHPMRLAVHGLLLDDAYFYSVLARNFDQYGFLTLDGEMPTNGVQPLWMIVQILLVKLLPAFHEVELLSKASWLLYLLFSVQMIRLVVRDCRLPSLLAGVFTAGVLLLNVRFQAVAIQGLETPLCLVVLAATWMALRRANELLVPARDVGLGTTDVDGVGGASRTSAAGRATEAVRGAKLALWRVVLLALLATLCFLARTDLFWVPLGVGIWLLLRRAVTLRTLGAYVAVVALLAGPYLSYNLIVHGGPLPISGQVKMFYSRTFFESTEQYLRSDEWTAMLHAFTDPFPVTRHLPIVITFMIFGGALMLSGFRAGENARRSELRLFGPIFLGHVLCMHLLYRVLEPRSAYYFAPELSWAVLVIASALIPCRIQAASRLRRGLGFAAAGLGLYVAASGWTARELEVDPYWFKRMTLAEDIGRKVPHDGRVGAFWPGLIAQFANRPVTPLDGVIGSRDYFENYVKQGRELEYILERERPFVAMLVPVMPDTLNPERKWLPWFHQKTPHWTRIGGERILERRHELSLSVLAARIVDGEVGGWFLMKVEPRAEKDASAAENEGRGTVPAVRGMTQRDGPNAPPGTGF